MDVLPQASLAQLFTTARTHNVWQPKAVPETKIRELYELLKFAPTSANSNPARFAFIHTPAAKERLLRCMAPGNVEKTKAAPLTVIIAQDMQFYEKMPVLFPHADMKKVFEGNQPLIEATAFRNSSLQGAYLMLAARAIGLDAGPMSGFDQAKTDAEFFAGTNWRSNFVCNLGYGDGTKLFPRGPRLSFEEACRLL